MASRDVAFKTTEDLSTIDRERNGRQPCNWITFFCSEQTSGDRGTQSYGTELGSDQSAAPPDDSSGGFSVCGMPETGR